jgi:hypothetical protein
MADDVVGADPHDGDTLALVFLAQPGQLVTDVLHVGAVVAKEYDQERFRVLEVVERDGPSVGSR